MNALHLSRDLRNSQVENLGTARVLLPFWLVPGARAAPASASPGRRKMNSSSARASSDMRKSFFIWQAMAIFLISCLAGQAMAGTVCRSPAPGEKRALSGQSSCFRLSQANRGCMESCMGQCRSAQQGCSGPNCRAQFQICARRCVVSCGSR
jgi:hypothetical protein